MKKSFSPHDVIDMLIGLVYVVSVGLKNYYPTFDLKKNIFPIF